MIGAVQFGVTVCLGFPMTHTQAGLPVAFSLLIFTIVMTLGTLSAQTTYAPLHLRSADVNRPVTAFVLDPDDNGFQFTSADDGVMFDIDGTGKPVRIGWTKPNTDDGFLFLDTNGNGRVDNGRELIGDGVRRPNGSRVVSGDDALMVIQGIIDRVPVGDIPPDQEHIVFVDTKDDVFTRLRFWRDANHNGQSEPHEFRTLTQLKIVQIFTGFHLAKRTPVDAGNIRLMEGTFKLQPSPDCLPQPGVRCDVPRHMWEMDFVRKD